MCRKFFLLISFVLALGLVVNASGQGTGTIMREVWSGIGGTNVSDLTNNANYPDNPTFGDELTLLETPTDFADNFGSRVYGWLHPATSGDYTFWIATDDSSNLYLSTDDDPANAVVIAGVDGWCPARAFDGDQGAPGTRLKSAPVSLVGGQKYYIMAIYKEGGGGDNLAVAWEGPDSPTREVIDGRFLSPAPWNLVLLKAKNPNPANGAVDADVMMLEWGAGPTAASYKVYLSTDATIDESDFLAEAQMTLQFADLDPGMTYYWRVDALEADGTTYEGNVWSFTTLPIEAHFPSPADGAKDIESGVKLSWTGGKGVIMHDVYFGTDEAAIAASDMSTFKGKVMATTFDPGALELFTTYYWKINEFSVTGINAGPVWSFSTPEYVVIDSEETTLAYDNRAEPYLSEAVWDTPQDLTYRGVSELTLRFHGGPGPQGSVRLDEATGTYSITGSGADIWDSSDQFHYGYRMLSGDGEIVARVVSNGTGTNTWAKGGVMIRETLDANSKHMIMAMTGGDGGGIAFQGRPTTGGRSNSYHGDLTAKPPYWVKLTRAGNTITAYSSADGVVWVLFTDKSPDGAQTNPIDVAMAADVYIGLFVTSHAAGEKRTFTFDNVSVAGNISAADMSTDIGIPFNTPEPIYVALEDSTGAVASVAHPYAGATRIDAWRQWTIPLSEFAGVDASSAAKFYFGVGDVANPTAGGTGTVRVDDIRVVHKDMTAAIASWKAAAEASAPGFIATNVADALYDIGTYSGDMTYEFAVRSNPDETEASMALIGRRQFGDTRVGLKYEQWNNTGTYGATVFGVLDYDYGIANNPGIDTHLVFVSNAGETALYVNGVYQASVATEISLSGNVGIGYGAQGADASGVFDDFDGTIFGVAIYDTALSADEIQAHSDAFFSPVSDVTVPSDIVQGVPNDGDWPGGETPPLAIDDKANTKYLHFKGDFNPDPGTGGTGFRVTPLDGASIVTGLTFTTANDAAPRDPVAFELSGSNESIDGPYTLIASGDIVDFAQADAWPRFTKNETPISFENDVAYKHYQIIFTAIRDAPNANSMQIAEVEFLGVIAPPPADVTAPGDIVQGVPNDGLMKGDNFGWPGAETPDLATDDDIGTKFLHFKGELEPTGFQIEPASGPSIVTGLTFTTANDEAPRDPVAFELSGSNDSIGGPYTLIASGDIVDFAQATAWPRFTMNATAITFDNDVAYKYYQVMFPAVRNPGSANSMQIAEVELIGTRAKEKIENILANGGFEDGIVEPWSTYGSATKEVVQELVGAAVPEAPIEGSSCLHVIVPAAGTNFWDAGLQHAGHIFEAGKKYTLSVYLKSKSGTLDINFKPELAADPWTGYGDQIFTITEEWVEYSITTPVMTENVDPASITFHIAFAPGDFWVDDAKFYESK